MARNGGGNPFEGDPGNPFQDPAVTQHRPSSEYATLDVYNPFENPGQREPPPYESRPSVPPAPPLPAPQLPKKTSPTEPRNYGSYGTQPETGTTFTPCLSASAGICSAAAGSHRLEESSWLSLRELLEGLSRY
ncbi:secretory carrier-associated membrane protein 3 [Sphaerodactylus townsendi]|uniref:secretory carrier-associated membrane protein 3 n=1 Tax=Sphaerodactylus townsendi TaxID=933632 RepID=UPI00202664A5|nr:secretory carrier-associated membrane protein 3 [Sphaerodactylus townsendi]